MKLHITRRYRKQWLDRPHSLFVPPVEVSYQISTFVIGTVTNASCMQIGVSGPNNLPRMFANKLSRAYK
ncbi:MAG: hypothetical protein JWN30_2077 [Bacilli bacterium]|nr:hypothetical protein [Bacilli bacterium]